MLADGIAPILHNPAMRGMVDIKDRSRINPVCQEYFGSARPASVLVEVSDLFLPGLLVEIDAVAYVPEKR